MGDRGIDPNKVLYEVVDSVAVVTLNRPEVLNALDMDVFFSLEACVQRAESDPNARAIVLAGQGRAFCSGLDMSLFAALAQGAAPAPAAGQASEGLDIPRLQECFSVLEHSSKPTIAAVHGPSLGGGLQLAIACDLRVAGGNVRLSAAEVRWGIIPDLGAISRLPRLIGLGRAREMVMTGRDVSADEALTWGLVNRVVEPSETTAQAVAWAKELAGGPPLAISAAKRLLNASLDRPVAEGLAQEATMQVPILASEDFREAVMAKMQKRAPRYQGR